MKSSSTFKSLVGALICLGIIIGFSMTSQAQEKRVVKMGFLGPLTGGFAGSGDCMAKGALLAAKMINEEGGILGRQVEILTRDDESRPAVGVRMARELNKEQGVNLFIGIISSGVALALKSVLEETNSLAIVGGAHSTKITGIEWSPNVFRICDDARTATYALAALIHEKFPQVKKWANISPDYEYGHSAWENFIEKLMQIDPEVKVVADRWPKFGAGGGYAPHINAILASGAEGLYSVLYGGDMIAFIREGRQHGLFDKIKVFTSTAVPSDIPYALQKEMVGVWTRDHYLDVIYTHPFSEKYKKYFKNTYGDKFFTSCQGQGTPVFDSVYAFKAAIEKAKSFEVKDIRKALEDLTLDTNLGKKWIRAGDHQAYFNMPFFHIMPDPKEEIGWKIDWFTTIDGKKFMIPVEEALKK